MLRGVLVGRAAAAGSMTLVYAPGGAAAERGLFLGGSAKPVPQGLGLAWALVLFLV